MRYYEGTSGILLSNVVFRGNDNGLTGGSQSSQITVEFCEFDANGTLLASSSSPSHNIYIYGGDFTLRYSYVHDPVQAQNFHIRAQTSVIEYNWFARAASYAGDLMTDDDYDGSSTFTQSMTFRGNVIVQGATQSNDSQIIAVYNDARAAGLTLNVTLLYNTFVGPSRRARLAGPPVERRRHADERRAGRQPDRRHHQRDARRDDLRRQGDRHPQLAADRRRRDRPLRDGVRRRPRVHRRRRRRLHAGAGSPAIGAAMAPATGAPDHEYYRDETAPACTACAPRADIGAFESTTTGAGVGPSGGVTSGPDGGAGGSGTGTGGAATGAGGAGAGGSATGAGGTGAAGGRDGWGRHRGGKRRRLLLRPRDGGRGPPPA